MKIAFYAPFKPLNHPHPSGDRVIGAGVYRYLADHGCRMWTASRFRLRWIYRRPWMWAPLAAELIRVYTRTRKFRPDVWLTYHSYYKAPDIIGAWVCRRLNIPYAIFQGIYATKHRRNIKTWAGYRLNTGVLVSADHVFANKKRDLRNLRRLIPESRLSFVAPGIHTHGFTFDAEARGRLRKAWGVTGGRVVLSAAMLRRDVKSEGIAVVLRACARLKERVDGLFWVVAGDGPERKRLESLAAALMPGRVRFVGQVPREEMAGVYSAADVFAFPGINESLGMVYLEAQSCGLPVAAYRTAGVPEAVADGITGLLSPPGDIGGLADSIARLLTDSNLRREMGRVAARHVRDRHELENNYGRLLCGLRQIVGKKGSG